MKVPNPWFEYADEKLALLEQSPDTITNHCEYDFALPADRSTPCFKDIYVRPLCLQTYLPPLPYVGKPEQADVIILCKNGGFIQGGDDLEYNNERDFVKESLKALKFESDYPIHYLDKRFKGYAGNKWWDKAIEYVVERALEQSGSKDDAQRERVVSKIAGIQWLPYHSKSLSIKKKILNDNRYQLASLSYTRSLLQHLLYRDDPPLLIVIYGNPAKKLWADILEKNDKEVFLEKVICKIPDYKGDINVKKLEPSFFKADDLGRVVQKLL